MFKGLYETATTVKSTDLLPNLASVVFTNLSFRVRLGFMDNFLTLGGIMAVVMERSDHSEASGAYIRTPAA